MRRGVFERPDTSFFYVEPQTDMLMPHPRRRTSDLLLQHTGDDLVVFDQQRNLSHSLNRTAALVFEHADGTRSIADLVAVLQAELNETADEDLVMMTLAKLRRARLLEEAVADRSAEALRASRRRFVRKIGLVGSLTLLLPAVETIVAPRSAMAQSGPSCDSDSDSGCASGCASGCDSSCATSCSCDSASGTNSASICIGGCSSACASNSASGSNSASSCSSACASGCLSACDSDFSASA